MDNNDYGYFGSGSSGYAHYRQTYNSCFGGNHSTGTGKGTGNHGADDVSWSFIFKLFGLSAVLLVIDYILAVLL